MNCKIICANKKICPWKVVKSSLKNLMFCKLAIKKPYIFSTQYHFYSVLNSNKSTTTKVCLGHFKIPFCIILLLELLFLLEDWKNIYFKAFHTFVHTMQKLFFFDEYLHRKKVIFQVIAPYTVLVFHRCQFCKWIWKSISLYLPLDHMVRKYISYGKVQLEGHSTCQKYSLCWWHTLL